MSATSPPPAGTTEPNLHGTVALILGASRGIGRATARVFAQRGATVLLASRDVEALRQVAREVTEGGAEAAHWPTDLADPASVRALGAWIASTFGRLDAAFNNAGEGYPPTPLADVPPEAFERVLRVSVTGTFLALREEIPIMLRAGRGAIVNMSSTAGVSGFAGGGPYIAAKHAILGLTKSAALDYASRGLRVNAVAPGPVDTERLQALPEEYRERTRQAVPMRRIGRPEEVGQAVAWLCSDAAAFVTGATLFLDGGRMAGLA
jgi:NAD(P)-dependent dehydrogenase (short-subunit alcohol dehydrogenase family)